MFGWTYDVIETPTGELMLCRLPGSVGGCEDQEVPRDACAVMLSTDSAAVGGQRMDSTWIPEFWVNDLDSAARRDPTVSADLFYPLAVALDIDVAENAVFQTRCS